LEKDKNRAREKIINTTTQLIKEFEDTSKITIRDIAVKAEVGSGLINYHFQTKQNLIDICILRIICQFIEKIEKLYETLKMGPIDKLKYVFKFKCDFIVANPIISKTSMIFDLNSAAIDDNTDQSSMIHYKVLKEIYGGGKTDSELFIVLHIIMSSIQAAYLRSNVIKAHTDIDFFNKEQRELYIDNLIDFVIRDI
jgi:AcrR family transcriptional regulator